MVWGVTYNSSLVGRYMENFGRNHWEATKWVFRYLVESVNKGLLYATPNEPKVLLKGYIDAVKEAIWLKGLISELGYGLDTIELLCDN